MAITQKKKVAATRTVIKVGMKAILQKCKHSWNNGLKVTVTEVLGADDFVVTDSAKMRYHVGLKNLKL